MATILALLSTWKGRTPRTLWPSLSCVSYGIFYLNNFDLEEKKAESFKNRKRNLERGKMGSFCLTPLSICDEMMIASYPATFVVLLQTPSRCCQSKHLCSPSPPLRVGKTQTHPLSNDQLRKSRS